MFEYITIWNNNEPKLRSNVYSFADSNHRSFHALLIRALCVVAMIARPHVYVIFRFLRREAIHMPLIHNGSSNLTDPMQHRKLAESRQFGPVKVLLSGVELVSNCI